MSTEDMKKEIINSVNYNKLREATQGLLKTHSFSGHVGGGYKEIHPK